MVSDAPSADAGAAGSGEPLAIICGGGSFPGAVAEAIKRRGRRPVMFPVRGWADSKVVERYTHHWIAIGQAGRFIGQQAVQLHGGMGMADELDVSHHFRRLTAMELTFGDTDHHLENFVALGRG